MPSYPEMLMARKSNLASMSVEALLKLRDDIGNVLSRRAEELKDQLFKLGETVASVRKARGSPMKGRKVAVKYRDDSGNTWAGRGARPVWLREKLKAGAKLEDFAVGEQPAARRKTAARRKATRRKKSGRSRRAKK
jgi:DNA-binding protein H-NS